MIAAGIVERITGRSFPEAMQQLVFAPLDLEVTGIPSTGVDAVAGAAIAYDGETGAIGGFKTLLAHVPGDDRTMVILNNTDMPQATQSEAGRRTLVLLYQDR